MFSRSGGAGLYLSGANLGPVHAYRVQLVLFVGGLFLVAIGGGWGLYFGYASLWLLTSIHATVVAIGAATSILARQGHTRLAAGMLLAGLYASIVAGSMVFDIPDMAAPRSIHIFLLVLGVVASLLTRGEPMLVRHGVPLVFFVTYLVFASSMVGLPTRAMLPDEIRVPGTWINNAAAMVMLYLVLQLMHSNVAARTAMETDLRDALRERQFLLHYQPQVHADGRVLGFEALVRWQHPRRGLVPPGQFIPLAEGAGLIVELGRQVLDMACAQLHVWGLRAETAGLVVSVNVSARQLREPDFVAEVLSAVARHGARADRLKLELTETALVRDVDDTIAKMQQLRAAGVGFSLDDFGTGFSSLSYLKQLPMDQLKIDQSFVRDVLTDPNDAAIACTVVSLGQSLGMSVIAEGVETAGQRDFLAANGCLVYQGYFFSRPLPVAEAERFLREQAAAASDVVAALPVHGLSATADSLALADAMLAPSQ